MSIPLEIERPSRSADRPLGQSVLTVVVAEHRAAAADPCHRSTFEDDSENGAVACDAMESAGDLCELYDNAPCGYHSLDPAGLVVRMNDTELRWLGYARDEVQGRMRLTDLVPRQLP
jgi:PAS domain-containing protein